MALPLALLIPLACVTKTLRGIVCLVASALVVAGPLLGGVVSLPDVYEPSDGPLSVRVMIWNTEGSQLPTPQFLGYLIATRPDLILLQEVRGIREPELPSGWNVVRGPSGTAVLSRFPAVEDGQLSWRDFDAGGGALRCRLDTPVGAVSAACVHLPTPRPGIEAILHKRFGGIHDLETVTAVRDRASRMTREWVGDTYDGLIVGGDFNTPSNSTIFRRDWAGLTDAFSAKGNGWGTTKQTRWFGDRIDHILFSPPWRCRSVFVGPAMGSDHRPVVADLTFQLD